MSPADAAGIKQNKTGSPVCGFVPRTILIHRETAGVPFPSLKKFARTVLVVPSGTVQPGSPEVLALTEVIAEPSAGTLTII